jgi:RecJ-like exonuclease
VLAREMGFGAMNKKKKRHRFLISGDCPECVASGECSQCDGTGINPHLHSENPKCPDCGGTGTCLACEGTGKALVWRPDGLARLLEKLFPKRNSK